MTDSLANRPTIGEFIAAFEYAERTVRQSWAACGEAMAELNRVAAMGSSVHAIRVTPDGHHHRVLDFEAVEDTIRKMRRDAWYIIVERLELRRMMSVRAWSELQKKLDHEKEVPPITREMVDAFARQYLDSLEDMLSDAVAEVFEFLRSRNGLYKRNSQLEVPKRVVLSSVIDAGFFKGSRLYPLKVHYSREQDLVALENVFNALDGKGQINKANASVLSAAVRANPVGQTDLFEYRACQNGNLHLTFKREDLLAKLNQIAGGRRLRPSAV